MSRSFRSRLSRSRPFGLAFCVEITTASLPTYSINLISLNCETVVIGLENVFYDCAGIDVFSGFVQAANSCRSGYESAGFIPTPGNAIPGVPVLIQCNEHHRAPLVRFSLAADGL